MDLIQSGKETLYDIDVETLLKVFDAISEDDEFLILVDEPDFLQVALEGGKFTVLEYQEGGIENQYQAQSDFYSKEDVFEVFFLYLKQDSQWKTLYSWKKLQDLEDTFAQGISEEEEIKQYKDCQFEELIFKNIDRSLKEKALVTYHGYTEEEAQEVLQIAQTELKRVKLDKARMKIRRKVQEIYNMKPEE